MRRRLLAPVLAVLLAAPTLGASASQSGAPCRFTEGFQALRDQLADVVGDCLEDAHAEAATGNTLQRTTGGLLAWRRVGNWTGFTDGNHTWVLGPFGLQQRGATERFDWEDAIAPEPRVSVPPASPSLSPALVPPSSAPAQAAQVPPPPAAAAPLPSCAPALANDDPGRAAPLNGPLAGTLPPAIWSRSADAPDRIAYRYYGFSHPGDASPLALIVAVGDEGGYKVRANVYQPDGQLAGTLLLGANDRQELFLRPTQPGTYLVQLSSYRPVEVPFNLDLRRG